MNDQWVKIKIDIAGYCETSWTRADGYRCRQSQTGKWCILPAGCDVALAYFAWPETAMDYWDVVQPVCPEDVSND